MDLPDIGFVTQARGYLANVRMQDWGGYVGMAILGYLQGVGAVTLSSGHLNFIVYLVTVACYLGFSFSVNNCFDHEGDRLGAKVSLNPVASGRISMGGGVVFSILLALVGLTVTSLWFGGGALTIYAIMLLLSGAYSAPPFRLKAVPVLDMASHGLFFGSLIVLYGVIVTRGFNAFTLPILLSVFNLSLILELRNQLDDIEEDTATSVVTTAVRIGYPRAHSLFYGLLALHMGILVYILNLLGNTALTAGAVVFFVGAAAYFFMKPDRGRFLLLMERITPLVYTVFMLSLLL